jgi:radical SAM/Cys-rich protein
MIPCDWDQVVTTEMGKTDRDISDDASVPGVESEAIDAKAIPPFNRTLARQEIRLVRDCATTLQINLGLLCNQTCKHCHLDAGPARRESMDAKTVDAVVAYATRGGFETIDITGGAPELNPHLTDLVTKLRPVTAVIMLRCNLSVLADGSHDALISMLREYRVIIAASLPAINAFQTNSQRGEGVYERSIAALRQLNRFGYGQPDSGLKLNIISNPTGAFIPSNQAETEKAFHDLLGNKYGIRFNQLFSFGNVPLGRFRRWLEKTNNYDAYIKKLYANFNPCAINGLMCRSLVSVSWDGYLYDCDFNLAAGLPLGGRKIHVSQMPGPPEVGQSVVVGEHCYTCTAGAGFT